MTPFVRLEGVAAPLLEENVDTDIIFPARFLLITAREGLGRYAFHDRRFDAAGQEQPAFVLNREPWREALVGFDQIRYIFCIIIRIINCCSIDVPNIEIHILKQLRLLFITIKIRVTMRGIG